MANHLYYGDNLSVLRNSIADESVDLIYLDPPFNSNASYNVLFKGPAGNESAAQIEAFDDTWHWTDSAEEAFGEVLRSGNGAAAEMLRAMRSFLGENDMMAYLAMMAVRLLELHRVLKPTGSLYLHCDPTASHYLKILLDAIFGAKNFASEIIWKRKAGRGETNKAAIRFGTSHDTILFYRKGSEGTFNRQYRPNNPAYIASKFTHVDDAGRRYRLDNLTSPSPRPNLTYEYKGYEPPANGWAVSRTRMEEMEAEGRIHFPADKSKRLQRKRFLDELEGETVDTLWDDISPINSRAQERLGYPTQKPVALLERILAASSNPGDVVLDPFCGCGTTVHAAEKLGRNWIGIDVTHLAIGLIEKRLRDAFEGVEFTTHGVPQDLSGARDLAARGRDDPKYYYEFEKWAVALLGGQPTKRTGDGGIDGNLYFGKTGRAIVEVKAGKVGTPQVARLRGALERHKADIGVFLALEAPNKGMIAEAAAAGHYEEEGFEPVPRIQIITIEDALELRDRAVRLPLRRSDAFRKAAREEDGTRQGNLDL